jgi:4-carboxymuconolactone decarboxylase
MKMDDAERYAQGMKMRRAVLGDAWVDKATAARTDLTSDWQDFITRTAWGDIWSRPALDRRTRSFMTIVLMISLGRWEELRLHIPAAFNNGLTLDEIKEAVMHAALYCGVPAGNHAFVEITQELTLMGRPPQKIVEP